MLVRSALPHLLGLLLLSAAVAQDCPLVDPRCGVPPSDVTPGAQSCESCGTFSACGVVTSPTNCSSFCDVTVKVWAEHSQNCGERPKPSFVLRAGEACIRQCNITTVALATANKELSPEGQEMRAAVYVVCSATDTFSNFAQFVADKECPVPLVAKPAAASAAAPAVQRKRHAAKYKSVRAASAGKLPTAARGEWWDDDFTCLGPGSGPRVVASDF